MLIKFCEITSGSVKIAAITKAIKIEYFLFLPNHQVLRCFWLRVIILREVKTYSKSKINFIISDKYSDILGSNSIGSEPSTLET